MLQQGGQYGCTIPTKHTRGRSKQCRNEITKWDETLSALHSPCLHAFPKHRSWAPSCTLHSSTVQSQHASLCRAPKHRDSSPGSLRLHRRATPSRTPPASSATATVALWSLGHAAASLPIPGKTAAWPNNACFISFGRLIF